MNRMEIIEYYTQKEIIKEILAYSKNREVAGAFLDGRYVQRPNTLQYANDIKGLLIEGVTSFHYSVERWQNPMAITKDNYEENRIGWDYIIDIDSRHGIEAAKIVASKITELLESYNIRNYGLKFSGSRGFHICLPWEMMPKTVNYEPAENFYPRLPNLLSGFIRHALSETILKELIRKFSAKKLGTSDPYEVVEVEKNWGNRHMFRSPYSLNEKTWLVSLPLKHVENFGTEMASIKNWEKHATFFKKCKNNEAEKLILDAMDWAAKHAKPFKPTKPKQRTRPKKKIPEIYFPPAIKKMLRGLEDGKKRSLFTLINFLRAVNWEWNDIWSTVKKWNEKNQPPLSRTILLSQFKWNQAQEAMMPANFDNEQFYKSLGIECTPEETKAKNPVNYAYKEYKKHIPKQNTFKCHICKKEFKKMSALKAHFSKSHGEV